MAKLLTKAVVEAQIRQKASLLFGIAINIPVGKQRIFHRGFCSIFAPSGAILEATFGTFWPSLAYLGPPWSYLGTVVGHLRTILAALGGSWAVLVQLFGGSWTVLGGS